LKPIVRRGQKVKKGDVLCEGYATQNGELALGRNLKVAFMPWKGYNFEDAIVISERIVREDVFTSLHVEEFVLEVHETKRGMEELTNDIPNVSLEATKDLDENGIIRIGAEVNEGDILIGKITPKGETDPTPEEKLLRAIFGDKAGDVKDASLKAPPSMKGVVIDKKLFSKVIREKKDRAKEKETLKAQNLLQEYEKEIAVYKAQQEERQRISADMHDELGAGMTAIRLMSEIARNKMKENTPIEIEKISRSADDVLNKMNAIIWSMNSGNDTLDNLVSYIRSYSQEYFDATNVECRLKAPDQIPDTELAGDKRRNIFLCLKETLNNTLKHADASLVEIDISIGDELCIRISDNGKGIDLDKLRQFGNGLKNIARRMESIGGTYHIENNNGTVTTLTLPL
ncbi:MAG TPA: histidine kinase, partial [Prolixibacteraceae bacterium]|nr:histidine kinase [Prolixibacteraceae bacterium]